MKTISAVVLLSGGLDSLTVLADAIDRGESCLAINFHYGQKHSYECDCAHRIAKHYGVPLRKVQLPTDLFEGSSLTDWSIPVPKSEPARRRPGVPSTYVPLRNSIFLTLASSVAEACGADRVYIGANCLDYSGYPDCRPEYLQAMEKAINLGCARSLSGHPIKIMAPLLYWRKKEIIERGIKLGVDYGLSTSCYQSSDAGVACGVCDSCRLRLQGFAQVGIRDPLCYPSGSGKTPSIEKLET